MYRLKCDLHITNQTLHTETFIVAIMLGINHYRHADRGYCGFWKRLIEGVSHNGGKLYTLSR